MRKIIIFVFVAIAAFAAFVVLSYFEQTFLGILLAVIMMLWPTVFWLLSKIIENRSFGHKKDDENSINQDIIEEPEELITSTRSEKFEEFRKKDENVLKAKAELAKLRKSLELINEEKSEGILNDETYNELKKQNEESIEKLEEEIAKSSGEVGEKKVYCKKGKHYISIDDCLPSRIDGYVICQEHNEEIRVE
jgi:hypothetical protein